MKRVAATVLVLLPLAATAAYVQYTECPDSQYDCSGPSCQTVDLPEGQCEANGNSTVHDSQWLECTPYAGLCAAIDYYAGSACSGHPQAKSDFICGECYKQGDGSGYVTPKCFYSNDGVPLLNITHCRDDKCSDCSGADSVVANSCVEDESKVAKAFKKPASVQGTSSSKFTGFRPGEFLYRMAWTTPDCSGDARAKEMIPARTCLNGAMLSCHN